MKLQIVAVGRLKAGPERDLVERYRTRAVALSRGLGFAGPDVVELPEARNRRPVDRQADEAVRLRERLAGTAVIAFDEGAGSLTSQAFAGRLAAWRDESRPAASLLIGGPDGLAPDLAAGADLTLSFGRMTLPHGLVRVLVCEGLYRALTILAGHPYHRGDVGDG